MSEYRIVLNVYGRYEIEVRHLLVLWFRIGTDDASSWNSVAEAEAVVQAWRELANVKRRVVKYL